MTGESWISPHPFSSLKSPQSLMPSHTHCWGIQRPLLQVNSDPLQVRYSGRRQHTSALYGRNNFYFLKYYLCNPCGFARMVEMHCGTHHSFAHHCCLHSHPSDHRQRALGCSIHWHIQTGVTDNALLFEEWKIKNMKGNDHGQMLNILLNMLCWHLIDHYTALTAIWFIWSISTV